MNIEIPEDALQQKVHEKLNVFKNGDDEKGYHISVKSIALSCMLFIFVIAVVSIIIFISLVLSYVVGKISLETRVRLNVKSMVKPFEIQLRTLIQDTQFLATFSETDYVCANLNQSYSTVRLTAQFALFSRTFPNFLRMRYFSHDGIETIRVSHLGNGTIEAINPYKNVSTKSYFQEYKHYHLKRFFVSWGLEKDVCIIIGMNFLNLEIG